VIQSEDCCNPEGYSLENQAVAAVARRIKIHDWKIQKTCRGEWV